MERLSPKSVRKEHVYGTPTNLDGASAMTPITDGSFWVAGWTFSVFTGYDAALWKIAADGTLLDSLLLNPADGNDRALAIARTAQGVVATGESESGVGVRRDVFLWQVGGEPTSVAETMAAVGCLCAPMAVEKTERRTSAFAGIRTRCGGATTLVNGCSGSEYRVLSEGNHRSAMEISSWDSAPIVVPVF